MQSLEKSRAYDLLNKARDNRRVHESAASTHTVISAVLFLAGVLMAIFGEGATMFYALGAMIGGGMFANFATEASSQAEHWKKEERAEARHIEVLTATDSDK